MKIICTQENLNQGLSIVSGIAGKNPNLPILNNVFIKAEKGKITLTTTNLEIGINCIIRGKVEKEGEFTLPAKLFYDYVNLLNKEKVEVEMKDKEIQILTSGNKTRVKGSSADEFPSIPEIRRGNFYSVKIKDLKEAISNIIFTISSSSTRPEISGAFFYFNTKEKELIVAGTDSYRLAEKRIPIDIASGEDKKIIIPSRTLNEVLKIINLIKDDSIDEKESKRVKIYLSEDNQILFSFPDTKMGTEDSIELISRLIEGNYPEYHEIIPENYNTKIIVNKKDLLNVVKTSSIFTKTGINSVKLDFLNKEKELTVFSSSAETGENLSKVDIKIEGDNNEIKINYKYLLDGLQNIESDEIEIGVINKDVPCILKPTTKNKYIYIIMPIRME
jgi:DNA polymerase III subunit beta